MGLLARKGTGPILQLPEKALQLAQSCMVRTSVKHITFLYSIVCI